MLDAQSREIAAAYGAGRSVACLARQYGRSESWVKGVLRAQGVQLRGRWEHPLNRDEVVAEYLAGASAAAIAERHGRAATTIAAILRQRNVRRRTRWDNLPPVDVAAVIGDYLDGASLRTVAGRHRRSITWVRETLASVGIPRRARGGSYKDVSDKLIVRLRDDACLSWDEIAERVGMKPESVAARYSAAPGALGHPRYNFAGAATDVEVWLRNDAANHRQEIVSAYRAGRSSESLARRWGISQRTVERWVGGSDNS
ncbi:hypothetical protein GCM10011575_41780 [Microlunatus endophyticus]|uniref:Helix-turn-helix domain-containing protein n=1 Tax=Microlunatus endophyticus TaxID=1716077 RepID=A0A917SGH4_9ACTN|nr:helix-turn-helix domain containing protein [Microlunatus endophyticus]GGL79067.1 hypothetical protein GCM10011575_41780 [Microlunatus endophyticus]